GGCAIVAEGSAAATCAGSPASPGAPGPSGTSPNGRSRGSPATFHGRPTGSVDGAGARPPDPGAVKCPRVVGPVPAPASGETSMSVLTQLLELGTLHHLCETPALRAELRGKLTPQPGVKEL